MTEPLPLLLHQADSVYLAAYEEKSNTFVRQNSPPDTGDYREAQVVFNPARPSQFAHATTSQLRCSEVVHTKGSTAADAASTFSVARRFEVDMAHVVLVLSFSPLGRYLVTYARFDPKRPTEENLCFFDADTGKLKQRMFQRSWPGLVWSSSEEYIIRLVNGALEVIEGSDLESEEAEMSTKKPLCRYDLMISKDKEPDFSCAPSEGLPLLAIFKPLEKNRPASLSLFRLPEMTAPNDALMQLGFGRADWGSIRWSRSSKFIALITKQGAGAKPAGGSSAAGSGDKSNAGSYYGHLALHLVNVATRSVKDVRLTQPGGGGPDPVHDCCWSPRGDELLVVHGTMPRNRVTVLNGLSGAPLMTFGESARNMALWSPSGSHFIVGGSGNLAGDYQFYAYSSPESSPKAAAAGAPGGFKPKASAVPSAAGNACVGEVNEKCSFVSWAPDSHFMMFATIFPRLRVDNKVIVGKKNGMKLCTEKFKELYGAHWVQMKPLEAYPARPASPRPTESEQPKPQAYRPPGGTNMRAVALLNRTGSTTVTSAPPPGPVGAKLAAPSKKKKRR